MSKIKVTDRDGNQQEIDAYDGNSLMETLRDEGFGVEAICGGQCACATCHCFIDALWFEKIGLPGSDEKELMESLDHYDEKKSRLTCQIEVSPKVEGLSLVVAPEE